MATHFSILAWKIPWTGGSGRLQSMGSQKSDTTEQLTLSSLSLLYPGLDVGDGNNTQNYFIIFRSK